MYCLSEGAHKQIKPFFDFQYSYNRSALNSLKAEKERADYYSFECCLVSECRGYFDEEVLKAALPRKH